MRSLQLTPLLLGQSGRLYSDPVGRSLPSRSVLVARPGSSPGRCLAGPGVPRPQLLVRRLRHGMGGSSRKGGHFRSVVSGGHLTLAQCSGTLGGGAQSPSFSPSGRRLHSFHLRRQLTKVAYLRNLEGLVLQLSTP